MIKTIYKIQWRIQTFREGWGGGGRLPQNFSRPFGPQFVLIIGRGPGPPGPSPGSATEIIDNHVKLREF